MKFKIFALIFFALLSFQHAFAQVEDCLCTDCDPTAGVACTLANGTHYPDAASCFMSEPSCGATIVPIDNEMFILAITGFLIALIAGYMQRKKLTGTKII